MHGVLNIDENKNKLHSLVKIDETNLLSLVSLWLDNNFFFFTTASEELVAVAMNAL